MSGASRPAHLYRHFDKDGALLYVGVSLSTLQRLADHKDCSSWFDDIARVHIERFSRREMALAAEREAIAKENPRFNIMRPRVAPERPAHVLAEHRNIVRALVLKPLYGKKELADCLSLRPGVIARLWEEGKLGYVVVGNHGGQGRPPRMMSTGWQVLTFLESLPEE